MNIRAKNKQEAWSKAEAIFGCAFKPDRYGNDGYGNDFTTYIPKDSEGYVDGCLNEYDDELELILADGDSIEICFEKELTMDELKDQIEELKSENKELRNQVTTLKGRLTIAERENEQNRTVRRMLVTYSKVAEDVEKYMDSVVEFHEFLGKVKDLVKAIGAEEGVK